MLRTDYLGVFESKYQRLRLEQASGYNAPELYQDSLQKVCSALDAHKIASGVALELGCGAGDLSLLLAEKGYRAYGIDISPTAISWAEEKRQAQNLDVDFRVGSVLDLPHADGFFDAVVDALCLHCIIGDDRAVLLSQVHRVLKPTGLFVVMTKCGEPKGEDYPFDPVTRCKIENGIATRYWGLPEQLVEEIQSGGFDISEWQVHSHYAQPLFFARAVKP